MLRSELDLNLTTLCILQDEGPLARFGPVVRLEDYLSVLDDLIHDGSTLLVSGYRCGYSQGDRTYLVRDLNVTTS